MRFIFSSVFLFLFPVIVFAKTISPLDYGLKQAKNGEARYMALYQTHEIAKKNQWDVSYKGIKELAIEIPSNAKSIPLGPYTDFCNVVISVTNKKKDNLYLFELSQDLRPVSISKSLFKSYDFSKVKGLDRGLTMLVVEDQNPWVENRVGYNYGAKRKDVILLKNGKALNSTIAPYDNEYSKPSCQYVEVTKDQKTFSNITLKRTKESTAKTFLVKVMNMNNVLLQGIKIITPSPVTMDGDAAIGVLNCTNITFQQVMFDQTYSFPKTFGYGIKMDNVWNSWFDHVEGDAAWGLFGNNNMNTAHVSNCRINRFDTHCYGRDFYFSSCEFSQYGLPQSSFMGELEFTNCTFRNATVCLARTEYNAYSDFHITIRNCTIILDSRHRSLVNLGNVSDATNSREELRNKYTPSLTIKNSTVVLSDDVPNWSLIHVGTETTDHPFDHIGVIDIDGLRVTGTATNLMLFDRPIRSNHAVDITLKGVDLYESEHAFLSLAQTKYVYTPTILFNINKDGNATYTIIDSKLNYSPLEFPHYNLHFKNCILGRIRYYNIKNGEVSSRRWYENCVFYLNDIDTDNYTLDDNADYKRCVFRPVDKKKKVVPYTMKKKTAEMTFENCTSDVNDLFGTGQSKKLNILKSYRYKFK